MQYFVFGIAALFFTFAGFYQMAIWAIGKHKAYKIKSTYYNEMTLVISSAFCPVSLLYFY